MLIHPAAIAAQTLANMLGRLFESAMRIGRLALAAHDQIPSSVKINVAGEKAAHLAKGDARFHRVVKILPGNSAKPLLDMGSQRIAGFHLLASHSDVHGRGHPFLLKVQPQDRWLSPQ
jgi:hypothetical protein